MKKIFFSIILVIFIFNLFSNPNTTSDLLEWGSTVLPPIHNIPDGDFKNMGCSDELIKIFNNSLGISKKTKILPPKRLLLTLRDSEVLANPFLKKTEKRSKFLYYSKLPTSFIPSYVLLVNKKKYSQLKTKTLSLKDILSNKQDVVGLQISRSYGKTLDSIIEGNNSNIYYEYNDNSFKILLNRLSEGKLDFLVGLPMEIEYFIKKLSLRNIRYLKIDELKNEPYTISYFGISKSEKGKKIIEIVDKILPKLRKSKKYKAVFEKWITKNFLKRYKKDYNNIFLKNKIK